MEQLSPHDAARLTFAVIQKLRDTFKENKQFTLANAATLMACLSNPGVKQGDLPSLVGGMKGPAIGKQLDLLEARNASGKTPRLLYKAQNEVNRKENDIIITEEGQRCWRRVKTDHLCRLKTDQGKEAEGRSLGCG